MGRLGKRLTLSLVVILLAVFLAHIDSASSLNSKEYVYGTTSVYGIDGYAVNLSLSIKAPIFTTDNAIIFSLEVLEPFSARGTIVNETDYSISRGTLNFYFTSGVVLDYDRNKMITVLWQNWGDSTNSTYVEEEKLLYEHNYWVNFSKSSNAYFGAATLPKLTEGVHNATVWIRAEQDQVTTYIPFWIAFSKTIILNATIPSPSVPELPMTISLVTVLVAVSLLLVVGKRKITWVGCGG